MLFQLHCFLFTPHSSEQDGTILTHGLCPGMFSAKIALKNGESTLIQRFRFHILPLVLVKLCKVVQA